MVRVLWHEVYPASLSRFFGRQCIHRRCHSPVAESVVRVLWYKVYIPSWSQSFDTKCIYCLPSLWQSFGTKRAYRQCHSLFGTKCTYRFHHVFRFCVNSTTSLWSVVSCVWAKLDLFLGGTIYQVKHRFVRVGSERWSYASSWDVGCRDCMCFLGKCKLLEETRRSRSWICATVVAVG